MSVEGAWEWERGWLIARPPATSSNMVCTDASSLNMATSSVQGQDFEGKA